MAITTSGRTDVEAYFQEMSWMDRIKHVPPMAFVEKGAEIEVVIVDSMEKLLRYPDTTKVMGGWVGKWRSDYFQFTVGQYREYANSRVKYRTPA